MSLLFTYGTLPFEEVRTFLLETDNEFPTPLSASVDINSYAKKLSEFSDFSICRDEDGIIGMISCYTNNPPAGYISNVCIKKEFQGRGVLSILFSLLVINGKRKGIKTVQLEVEESNTSALNVYLHLGFHLVETRKERNKLLLGCDISRHPIDYE